MSVCSKLKKAGFEQVYNLRGGLAAWEGAEFTANPQELADFFVSAVPRGLGKTKAAAVFLATHS